MSPVSHSQDPQKGFSLEESTAELIKVIRESRKNSIAAIRPSYPRYKTMAAIMRGMDETLGNGTSNLILQAMNQVYHIDEECIVGQPKLFVDTLVKLLGKDAIPHILAAILDKMKNQII
jgi:hypothetical protein